MLKGGHVLLYSGVKGKESQIDCRMLHREEKSKMLGQVDRGYRKNPESHPANRVELRL